ncbi:MAG: type II secretion system F family protein [Bdellovibrionota bacterium]
MEHMISITNLLSSFLFFYFIMKLFVYAYREHTYLYQMQDRETLLDIWIGFLRPVAKMIKADKWRQDIENKLLQAGNKRNWQADHLLALGLLLGILGLVLGHFLLVVLMHKNPLYEVIIGGVLFFIPYLKLSEIAKKRSQGCERELPYFIDFLSLCMGAGLDFNNALSKVLETAPKSDLATEFGITIKNIKLGMSRKEALMDLQKRMNVPSLRLFIQTLVQGIETGTDIMTSLENLSSLFLSRKFQKAEEGAGRISVQMMIPMMLFVMPAVMIILMGPMVMQYAFSL